MLKLLIMEMRPHHWIKNLFVFAALIFAKKMFYPEKTIAVIVGFFAFSIIGTGIAHATENTPILA